MVNIWYEFTDPKTGEEIEVELKCSIESADPSVGIMSPYMDDYVLSFVPKDCPLKDEEIYAILQLEPHADAIQQKASEAAWDDGGDDYDWS